MDAMIGGRVGRTRAMLILAAVIARPPTATAQPAAGGAAPALARNPPAQVAQAAPTEEVVVSACAMPEDSEGYATRSIRRVANQQFDPPPHPVGRTEESPGTRAFILRNIDAFQAGTADFDHMNTPIADITRANLRVEKRWITCRGTLKGVTFLHVSQDGFDDFEVDFSGAAIEWEVAPLNAQGRTEHWAARFYYPEPVTGRFEELLRSMERGRFDYGRVAPGFAPVLQAQWPALRQAFGKWRGAHAIAFLRKADDGAYVFKVGYGERVVFWKVGPLDAAGRITGLAYEEGA